MYLNYIISYLDDKGQVIEQTQTEAASTTDAHQKAKELAIEMGVKYKKIRTRIVVDRAYYKNYYAKKPGSNVNRTRHDQQTSRFFVTAKCKKQIQDIMGLTHGKYPAVCVPVFERGIDELWHSLFYNGGQPRRELHKRPWTKLFLAYLDEDQVRMDFRGDQPYRNHVTIRLTWADYKAIKDAFEGEKKKED